MGTQFGDLLRESRRKAGKTLTDVARVLGVSVVYLSDIERGNRAPLTRDRIDKVARYLGIGPAPLTIAAAQQKGVLEFDVTDASDMALKALSGMARGGISDEQWQEILKIVSPAKTKR